MSNLPKNDAHESAHRCTIAEITARHLGLETLDERGSDRLDFHDCSVGSIRAALEAAYAAGAASVTSETVRA